MKCEVGDNCDLTAPHVHCGGCNFALPSAIVYLEQREPTMGESLKIIPGNYVVQCPSCKEGTLVRVRSRKSARQRDRRSRRFN